MPAFDGYFSPPMSYYNWCVVHSAMFAIDPDFEDDWDLFDAVDSGIVFG